MMYAPPGYGPMATPASYYGGEQAAAGGAMMEGHDPGYGGYEMGMGGDACPYCGGAGCGYCSQLGDGILAEFFRSLLPYGEGGACAPRWYDITVDGLYWTRDQVSEYEPFTAFTRNGAIIMSSDSLDYEREPGLRLGAAVQLLPGVALDFSYSGLFNWATGATVTSPAGNELFSPYNNFGAVAGVGAGFDEADQARVHSLRTSTTIDTFELSARKYWTGPNCRLQGSWRSGVRYFYLVDDLNYTTIGRTVPNPAGPGTVAAGQSTTDIRTYNSLIGWQAGFDLWASVVPGVMFGSELKAGVYGNHAKYNTQVVGSTTAGPSANLRETNNNNDVAVLGEANLLFLYRVSPNWTIRGGYSLLYVDGLALAPENFNSTNPFNQVRNVQELNDNGYVLYHGGFMGLEWMW